MNKILFSLMLLGLTSFAVAQTSEPADPEALRAEWEQARSDLALATQRVAILNRQMGEQGLTRRGAWPPRLGVVLDGPDESTEANRVRAVTPGSSAAAAGVEPGDRLLSLDGVDISERTGQTARQVLRELESGDTVTLELERNGQWRSVEVVLESREPPAMPLRHGRQSFNPERLPEQIHRRGRLGCTSLLGRRAELTSMHPDLALYFGIDRGVLVLRVDPEQQLDLRAGDVILAIDEQPVNRPTDVMLQAARSEADQALALELMREGERVTLTVSADALQPRTRAHCSSDAP